MPSMANITIKKNDGTTDIVYTAMAPSSGDGVSAVWRATGVGSASAHAPELRLSSREASKGTKRALRATFMYPQIATNTTTGITSVVQRSMASVDWTCPKDMSVTDIQEYASQFANLIASVLIKDCVKSGFSAS